MQKKRGYDDREKPAVNGEQKCAEREAGLDKALVQREQPEQSRVSGIERLENTCVEERPHAQRERCGKGDPQRQIGAEAHQYRKQDERHEAEHQVHDGPTNKKAGAGDPLRPSRFYFAGAGAAAAVMWLAKSSQTCCARAIPGEGFLSALKAATAPAVSPCIISASPNTMFASLGSFFAPPFWSARRAAAAESA